MVNAIPPNFNRSRRVSLITSPLSGSLTQTRAAPVWTRAARSHTADGGHTAALEAHCLILRRETLSGPAGSRALSVAPAPVRNVHVPRRSQGANSSFNWRRARRAGKYSGLPSNRTSSAKARLGLDELGIADSG